MIFIPQINFALCSGSKFDELQMLAQYVTATRQLTAASDVIDQWALKEPNRLALLSINDEVTEAAEISFGYLSEGSSFLKIISSTSVFSILIAAESNRFANALLQLGFEKGERVILMVPRIPEWYICMLWFDSQLLTRSLVRSILFTSTVRCISSSHCYTVRRGDVSGTGFLGLTKIGLVAIPSTTQLSSSDISYRCSLFSSLFSLDVYVLFFLFFFFALCARLSLILRSINSAEATCIITVSLSSTYAFSFSLLPYFIDRPRHRVTSA
jgi:hypothetical protein